MSVQVTPRPRPAKRVRLSRRPWARLREKVLAAESCAGCGIAGWQTPRFAGDPMGLDAHHVYGRDLGGDDVLENLAPLHHACHMAYEDRGRRWLDVAAGVRGWLTHRHLLYLIWKLGSPEAAREFLDRYYPERPTKEA